MLVAFVLMAEMRYATCHARLLIFRVVYEYFEINADWQSEMQTDVLDVLLKRVPHA